MDPIDALTLDKRGSFSSELTDHIKGDNNEQITITVLGASGDLAAKKIYPVLWKLWNHKFLSQNPVICGYARSKLSHEQLVAKISPYLEKTDDTESREAFLKTCTYHAGAYDSAEAFASLNEYLTEQEKSHGFVASNRIFYLALPPAVFGSVSKHIKSQCWSKTGWNRVIVEKPFGHDSESSAALGAELSALFTEKDLYRIDHYLGKEMVQNLMIVRFANTILTPAWNRDNIASVQITFKENFGTKGRGGYFDSSGIIRDVLQNHLLQVLTIVAMEKPVTTNADDIRSEKVKVLKCIDALEADDCVLGQYAAGNIPGNEESKMGYKDDPTVPNDSKTPTFATCVMYVRNERWDGIPFIMRAGKALNERKAEVRIQFKDVPGDIFSQTTRNELVVRIQPDEALYMQINNKKPGFKFDTTPTYLDLSYSFMYKNVKLPEAYERLILDVVHGEQLNFVRDDELVEAWRIFTPLLHQIERKEVDVIPYVYGSRGPKESDELIKSLGYVYTEDTGDWAKAKAKASNL